MAIPLLLDLQKALIFRIVHRDNVPWILANGIHAQNGARFDVNHVNIGNPDLIERRKNHPVPCLPGGTLGDYVPFYFTPRTPMLLNIKTGWNGIPRRENREIIVLVSSIAKLAADHLTFLFTDRHAYLATAQFFSDPADLDQIDWPLLRNRDFRRDPGDPGKLERYQAEALVHRHLPNEAMLGIVCYDGATQAWLQTLVASHRPPLVVVSRPGWYFR